MDTRDRLRGLEAALVAVEALPEAARETALDALQALLQLYGAALARVLEKLDAADRPMRSVELADDELIGHLLMVHGLHPLGFEDPQEVPGAPGGPPLVQLDMAREGAR